MKKVLNICLLTFLAVLLWSAVISFGGVLPEYAIPYYEIAAVLVGLWGLKWILCRRVSWVWSPLHIPVALFFLYALVRYFQSPIEHDSRVELFFVGLYTTVYLLVAQNLYRTRDRLFILGALVLLGTVESIYSFWQYKTVSDEVLWVARSLDYHGRGSGTYYCPNHLAGLLEMILGLTATWLIVYRIDSETIQSTALRWLFGLASIAVMIGGLYTTLSRGGFLAILMTIPLILMTAEAARALPSRLAIGAFLSFLVLAGALWFVPSIRARIDQSFDINLGYRLDQQPIHILDGLTGRFPMWRSSVALIRHHPWLGAGPATWQWLHLQFREPALQIHPQYAHNDVLQLFAEYGIVGFLLIFAMFAIFYWQAFHLARREESMEQRAFCLGAMAAVTAILIHSFVDFNLHIPANTLVVAVLLGLVAAQGRATGGDWRYQVPAIPQLLLGLVILVAAFGSLRVAIPISKATQISAKAYEAAQIYEWDQALRLYGQAEHFDPHSPEIQAQIGDLYRVQSTLTTNADLTTERRQIAREAVTAYQKSIDLNPYDSDVLLRMAYACELSGDSAAALQWYNRTLEVDPNNFFVWLRIGGFYSRQGDTTQAVDAWERARRLNPNDATALNLLNEIKPPHS